MKKITMLVFLSFCAIGFSQNSQDQNKEIKAPSGNHAQTVALPAAYFNNSARSVGETAGVANNWVRNTNVTVPFTGTYYSNRPDAMIYDNGPHFNVAGSPNLSVLESVTLGMGTYGVGAQFTAGNSVADDVVFTDDVDITSIDVFAYQSFETPPTITGVYLQVWDGDPSGSSASVIWGNLTDNILGDAVYADANRVLEDDQSSGDRQINRVTANTTGLSLTAGTYWIEYTFEGSGTSGPWAPPVVILGQSTTGNALQYQSSIGGWVAIEDVGPQGLPFVIYGEIGGGIVYCIPEGTNSDRFVDNFSTTGGSENISNLGSGFSAGGYGDFYDTNTVKQEQDGTVDFSVDIEGGTAGFRVWVDWNQDGVFDTTQEVAYMSSSYETSQTGSITVPSDALEGDTRMRIVSHWLSTSGDVDPCETGFTYGEFEDYKFTVTAGGGGTGGDCEQEHVVVGDGNGGSGSSVDSDYISAADIVVVAGEDFTLDTIEVSFLTFAPEDAPVTANVIYYEDEAGLPGAEIGTETVVPTILSSGEWVNPIAFRFDTRLDMTPFTFDGNAGSDTSYWIGIEMGTATNQQTVFWLYTEGAGIEGEPMAQFNAADGFWSVPEPTREVGYVFSGNCNPLSVADNTLGGFTFYPNPTSGSLSLKSINNIDSVSLFNLLGQKVLDVKIGATTSDINLSGLTAGTYIMHVSVEGQIGTYKVLKN